MSFQSNAGGMLPPIKTSPSISNASQSKTILPPVSCLAPPLISPVTPPPDFTNNSSPRDVNSYVSQSSQPYLKPERMPPHTSTTDARFHFHPDSQQYVDHQQSQSFSPTRAAGSMPQQLSHIPPSSPHHHNMVVRPMHHPYVHPMYHQSRPAIDPASELLAEKRRRNAGASARFRDRRKQREREMQEKCQFLERRVQELEGIDSAKRIAELEKKLDEANKEKDKSDQKLHEQDNEIHRLRSRLCEREFNFLTPPSSEYESKDNLFDDASRLSRSPSSSSTSSDHRLKPTDVKSLLS